jgi:hypothetical protein
LSVVSQTRARVICNLSIWNHGFSLKPQVYENQHKITQIFLILRLPYIQNGDGLLNIDCLVCLTRMGGWVALPSEPLHTRDWEPVTITLQTLPLVEKAEPVQVQFTLRLRDQHSTWMQDGCKVYLGSYMASNGSHFMVTWIIFKYHLLEVSLTQNRETWHSKRSSPLIYFILSCMRTRMNRNSLK